MMADWVKQQLRSIKERTWWHPFKNGCIFVIHFIVVMLLLCCAAYVLAKLEDPEIMNSNNEEEPVLDMVQNTTVTNLTANSGFVDKRDLTNHAEDGNDNTTAFWKSIQNKYNISEDVSAALLEDLLEFLWNKKNLVHDDHEPKDIHHGHDGHTALRGKKFIFMKWFYFVVVATTTIGYGHVHPKTDQGKLFYIMFSAIGIVLMMTLLRSCGKIIMTINRKFYKLIRRYLFNEKEYISDPMTSVISMCLIFLVFMLLVVIHDKKHWCS